jgi:hypothetical protein
MKTTISIVSLKYLYLVFKSYLTFTSAIIFNLTLIWIAGGEYDSRNFEQV